MPEQICQSCGEKFEGRKGAKTCSDRCRQRLKRGTLKKTAAKSKATIGLSPFMLSRQKSAQGK